MLSNKQKTIISLVPIIIIILFFISIVVDFHQIKNNHEPIFVLKVETLADGSEKYLGILYCVYKVKTNFEGNSLNEYVWELVPWFTKYEDLTIFENYT